MFEIIENEIYNIQFKYTKLENYYKEDKLQQDCFILLKKIHNNKIICDSKKIYLQDFLFFTYEVIIWLWNIDATSKGDF